MYRVEYSPPWRWRHDSGDSALPQIIFDPCSRHPCKSWDKELSSMHWGGRLDAVMGSAMYLESRPPCTELQQLKNSWDILCSYCVCENRTYMILHWKKVYLRSYRDSNSPNWRLCCSNRKWPRGTHPWDKGWGWPAQNSAFSGCEQFFLEWFGENQKLRHFFGGICSRLFI